MSIRCIIYYAFFIGIDARSGRLDPQLILLKQMLIYLALSVKFHIEVYKSDPYRPRCKDEIFLLAPAALRVEKMIVGYVVPH